MTRAPALLTRPLWLGTLVSALALLAAACAGGEKATTTPTLTPTVTGEGLVPEIVSTDLAVGPNNFSLGLLSEENEVILGAQVHLRFFQLVDDQAVFRGEGNARPVQVTLSFTETRPDGTTRTIETGQIAVYKANVEFDQPGPWAVEITATLDGQSFEPASVPFQVRERSLSPAIGDPAPKSRQTILADVGGDISKIDTSDPADPDMHAMTIAEAVTSGQSTLIVFATPAFCLSRTCGPTKQIVDQLYPTYKGQVNFIHVEPYFLDKVRSGEGLIPVPVMEEWGLQTEPWVFVIDGQGNVAAKFEGVVAPQELEAAIQAVL